MDSPFGKAPPHPEIAPAWRALALLLIVAVASLLALAVLGFVRFDFTGKSANGPKPIEPAKKEEPKNIARSFIERDEAAEKTLQLVLDHAVVFKSRGALVEYRLESEADGKTQTLANFPALKREADAATNDIEAMVIVVRRTGSLDAVFSSGGVSGKMSNLPLPELKPSSPANQITRSWESVGTYDLKGREGKEFVIHKMDETEMIMKKDDKGEFAAEKEKTLRTLRLVAKVIAVKLEEAKE